jgi:hypothetical protein
MGSSRESVWLDCRDLSDAPMVEYSAADPEPGSGAFLNRDPELFFFRIPDPKPLFLWYNDKFLSKKY